jgi:7-cyano-7-deazaguanine synthase
MPTYSTMPEPDKLAVLVSGGLDSAILVGDSVARGRTVHPLYVRCGLCWETAELDHLRRFLAAIARPGLEPLHVFDLPVRDLYQAHWSLTGDNVPGAETPDEAVFLPGRNVLLLAKALIWCHLRGVPVVGLAPLESNPFPDATPAFFAAYESIVNKAVDGSVRLWLPYRGLSKVQVMHRGQELPLELTFSCIRPLAGRHCGRCNKCAERLAAFRQAGLIDRTPYDREGPCSA